MTDSEKDFLLHLLTKWQDEEVEKELKMDTAHNNVCIHF